MTTHTPARVSSLLFLARRCSLTALAGCGSGPGERIANDFVLHRREQSRHRRPVHRARRTRWRTSQVVPVEKSKLPRVLRLTGAVAYNAFATTPVFSAVGGPVQEILAQPGEHVRAGQTAAHRQQPRLFRRALRLHESAKMRFSSPTRIMIAPRISTITKPSPSATSSRRNPTAPRPRPTCNPARMPCAPSASTIPNHW